MVPLIRWVVGVSVAAVFVFLAAVNWGYPVLFLLEGQRGSAIPLLGGVAGIAAYFLLPVPILSQYRWCPLLIDYGCIPVFVASAIARAVAILRDRLPAKGQG